MGLFLNESQRGFSVFYRFLFSAKVLTMFKNKALQRDEVFSRSLENIPEFQFDEKVTKVFEDMIQRSVPGYDLLIYMIGLYAQVFTKNNTNIYDLGCSTGVATCMMANVTKDLDVKIIAIDNSAAMIKQCKQNLKAVNALDQVNCVCSDINDVAINQASMVVLNLTLQFIDPSKRASILKTIYQGMNQGGVLVLSEKVVFEHAALNKSMIELHQAFKKTQGYSELEISQKRASLENFLIPDTIEQHVERLKSVGFSQVILCFQCLNFVSFLAIK